MTLFASTKGSVTADKSSRKGTSGWRKGQTLRISDDDKLDDWCTDCYVKILLDVTTKGKYQIMAKTNTHRQSELVALYYSCIIPVAPAFAADAALGLPSA